MHVFAATKNAGKLRELRDIFAEFGWRVDVNAAYEDVVEGESSYADNAALKARALAAQLHATGSPAAVLGDDSGLEVFALDGRPGVLSARYGAPDATWAQRRAMLLAEISEAPAPTRDARFVCALHLILADGREFAVESDVAGVVAEADRGDAGFSYDAIFVYPPIGKSFAELSEHEKNAVSHRARAARALVEAVAASEGKDVAPGM